jgi:c(7)-type cytochrome triheme protein
MKNRVIFGAALAIIMALFAHVVACSTLDGKAIYEKECALCHNKSKPKIGDAKAWEPLLKGGLAPLYASTIQGKGDMDPRGGNDDLTDAEIQASVNYLVSQSGGADQVKAYAASAPVAAAAGAPVVAAGVAAAIAPLKVAGAAAATAATITPVKAISTAAVAPVQTAGAAATTITPVKVTSTAAVAPAPVAGAAAGIDGKAIYDKECALCHNKSKPKIGDAKAWETLLKAGMAPLYASTIQGKGDMDPRGGNDDLTDAQIQASVNYLVSQSGGAELVKASAASMPIVVAAAAPMPAAGATAAAVAAVDGKAIYDKECALCHNKSKPKIGDAKAWETLLKAGMAPLYASTIQGKGDMDPRGGNDDLTDAQIQASVNYLVSQSGGAELVKAYALAAPVAPTAGVAVKTAAPNGATEVKVAAVATSAVTTSMAAGVNVFNRLMRSPIRHNLAPSEDGLHDKNNEGTLLLQSPSSAFNGLPKSNAGNRVNWGKAIEEGLITPRSDRLDAKAKLRKLDTKLVREVKGSMGDVVFPHKTHVQWLACANCHPAIFANEIGATKMTMASILQGEQCGVCHGTVAFPISECRRCHSKDKPSQVTASGKP